MEFIDYILWSIVCWGTIGAVCLMFIGIKADIQNYRRIKRDNKTNEELKDWKWPYQRKSGIHAEYSCPHGIGHSYSGIHGCDGCCRHPSFHEIPCGYIEACQNEVSMKSIHSIIKSGTRRKRKKNDK